MKKFAVLRLLDASPWMLRSSAVSCAKRSWAHCFASFRRRCSSTCWAWQRAASCATLSCSSHSWEHQKQMETESNPHSRIPSTDFRKKENLGKSGKHSNTTNMAMNLHKSNEVVYLEKKTYKFVIAGFTLSFFSSLSFYRLSAFRHNSQADMKRFMHMRQPLRNDLLNFH